MARPDLPRTDPDPQADEAGVLVVGAGPVGLVMACELLRHGVPCRVVDSKDGPSAESRALAVHSRTLEAFDDMGIAGEAIALGRTLVGVSAHEGGRRIVHIRFGPELLDSSYPFVLCLPQGQTERLLNGLLGRLGGSVEWRTRLTALRQGEGGVLATLADPEGRDRDVRARWLVGCDGAHSVVRHQLGLTFEGSAYEEHFLLADVRLDWDLPDEEVQILLTPEGAIGAFPLPEPGLWRLVDATGRVQTDDPARIVERFRWLLHTNGHPEAVLPEATWTSSFRIHRRIVERFRVGHGFVAGDAAHIHSPAGGQGMNTGIQDAYNLAWKLGLVRGGTASDSLLDSFEAERLPIAAKVLRETDLGTRLATLRNPFARAVRNRLASIAARFPPARRRSARILSELDINYRDSTIVAEDGFPTFGASGPRAGDRIGDLAIDPDAGGPARLFDLLRGPRHTLLLFRGDDPILETDAALVATGLLARSHLGERVAAHLVSRSGTDQPRWEGSILSDPEGHLHQHFGAHVARLYLVRPDGYVGYRAQPPDPTRFGAYVKRLLT